MTIQEENKFLEEKIIKIRKEKDKKEQKKIIDYKLFNDRINMIFNELKTNRKLESDKMFQRHRCVLKELETNQKLEISNLDKITKGISSNLIFYANFFLFFRTKFKNFNTC